MLFHTLYYVLITVFWHSLKERLSSFFGSFQILFDQIANHLTFFIGAHVCFVQCDSTSHVPAYTHQIKSECFFLCFHLGDFLLHLEFGHGEYPYTKKFDWSKVIGTSNVSGAPFSCSSLVVVATNGLTENLSRCSVM